MSIKIAVAGAGYWGPNIIRNFSQIPSCEMATCCDLDEKRLAHMKRLYPRLNTTTNYDDVINEPVPNRFMELLEQLERSTQKR